MRSKLSRTRVAVGAMAWSIYEIGHGSGTVRDDIAREVIARLHRQDYIETVEATPTGAGTVIIRVTGRAWRKGPRPVAG